MTDGSQPQASAERPLNSRLKSFIRTTERIHPAYGVAIVLAISVVIFALMTIFRSAIVGFGRWGYLAAFAINATSTATVVLPAPGFAALLILARDYNFFWLGVSAGVGGTLGELVAYWLGMHGGRAIEGKRLHAFLNRNMHRYGGGILIAFSLIPFMIDLAGIFAGATRYPVLKFLLYVGIGKTILMIGVMYAAAESIKWAEPWLDRFF